MVGKSGARAPCCRECQIPQACVQHRAPRLPPAPPACRPLRLPCPLLQLSIREFEQNGVRVRDGTKLYLVQNRGKVTMMQPPSPGAAAAAAAAHPAAAAARQQAMMGGAAAAAAMAQ